MKPTTTPKTAQATKPDPNNDRTWLSGYISPELKRRVRLAAADSDISMNELLMIALDEYLTRHGK